VPSDELVPETSDEDERQSVTVTVRLVGDLDAVGGEHGHVRTVAAQRLSCARSGQEGDRSVRSVGSRRPTPSTTVSKEPLANRHRRWTDIRGLPYD
jgi:hypothetical protein